MNYFLKKSLTNYNDNKMVITIDSLSYDVETCVFSFNVRNRVYKFKITSDYGYISLFELTNKNIMFCSNFEQNSDSLYFNDADIKNYQFMNLILGGGEISLFYIYKTKNGDLLIYQDNADSILCECDSDSINIINIDETMYFGEYIHQNYGEDEKLSFKKNVYRDRNNDSFFKMMRLMAYKRLYLDFECDFLLNFIKFMCDKNDENVIEFLNSNPKYKMIYDVALSDRKDILTNEIFSTDVIKNEFKYKTLLQNVIQTYTDNDNKINNAESIKNLEQIKTSV